MLLLLKLLFLFIHGYVCFRNQIIMFEICSCGERTANQIDSGFTDFLLLSVLCVLCMVVVGNDVYNIGCIKTIKY